MLFIDVMATAEVDFKPEVEDIETLRKANIARNKQELKDLGIFQRPSLPPSRPSKAPPSKKRKLSPLAPSRTSARIANAPVRPSYNDDISPTTFTTYKPTRKNRPSTSKTSSAPVPDSHQPTVDSLSLESQWTGYSTSAPPPIRSDDGTFHFPSHPTFTPNKSPSEMLREGVFGGSYFRPLYSRHLCFSIIGDWTDIPQEWYEGLNVKRFLTSPTYDPEVNKFKVKCGQSIEEWEAAGWIAHNYDPRGWFQWYCRFWLGRRCEDDDRQVGRWERCVGRKGRWRRLLLKKYRERGVRECFDYGEGDEEEEVSPVMHQTCFQWGYE